MSNAQIDGKVRIFGEAVKRRKIFKMSAKKSEGNGGNLNIYTVYW